MAIRNVDEIIGMPVVLPNMTPWTAFTPPTTQGLGTLGLTELFTREDGEDLLVEGRVVLGTTSAVEARIAIPSAYTAGLQKGTGRLQVGEWKLNTTVNPSEKSGTVLIEPTTGNLLFSVHASASAVSPIAPQNGNAIFISGATLYLTARIPCTQLAGGMRAYGAGAATANRGGLISRESPYSGTPTALAYAGGGLNGNSFGAGSAHIVRTGGGYHIYISTTMQTATTARICHILNNTSFAWPAGTPAVTTAYTGAGIEDGANNQGTGGTSKLTFSGSTLTVTFDFIWPAGSNSAANLSLGAVFFLPVT